MRDRNRQLGASTTAPTIAQPCTECRGFNVPALVRGRYQRGTCPACGGTGTIAAQTERSDALAAMVTRGDRGEAPPVAPAPAEAAGEVLPLWERDNYGDWSRGMFLPSHILLADGRATIHMGSVDPMEWEVPPGGTVEDAMRYVDEAAVRAGHRLPADSMVFRPELADEVRGTVWYWYPGDDTWTFSKRCPRVAAVIYDLRDVMTEEQAADALARILRVHGADVREVGQIVEMDGRR